MSVSILHQKKYVKAEPKQLKITSPTLPKPVENGTEGHPGTPSEPPVDTIPVMAH